MNVLNQFTKNRTNFQSSPETEKRLMPVDASTSTLVQKTRTRRVGSETYTYSGGSKEAADALRIELEATPGMGEVYGYSNDPVDPNAAWTVVASPAVISEWGAWV
ncbi:MAG: hypothetical protein PHW60_05700 [Kiritimatiellae bacterium]|nr:hypothetical protein [Kiritimatiellia bacterium]